MFFRLLWMDICCLVRWFNKENELYVQHLMGECKMALLSKDAIWQAQDLTFQDVNVPEWGGTVRIRALSGSERDAFESKSLIKRGNDRELNTRNLRARLIAATAIDEEGKALFEPSDVIHLGQKSAKALERLFDAARKLSGMTAADVDELTENLDETPNEDSISV